MLVFYLFFGLGLGIVIALIQRPSEMMVRRYLKSRGMEFCRCCDEALARSSMGLCSPCQYFYDEEEKQRYEKDMLELAR